MSEDISTYSYRHAFATNWLEQGRNIPKLCEILNTSLKMLQDHYGHLAVFQKELREALDEFTQAGENASSGSVQSVSATDSSGV